MSNMVVNTNVMALNAHRALKGVGNMQSAASAKLSSGLKINSAADDAAGLAISEKMRSQIRGLDMASKNAQDGISLLQTAEGGMTEIGNMVQRIRELTVQASNETNDLASGDLNKIAGEASQLIAEIDSMAGRVEFNKKNLLNGTTTSVYLQVGANANQSLTIDLSKIDKTTLGLDNVVSAIKAGGATASAALSSIDSTALTTINDQRAKLGAYQNRLEYTIRSLDISSENLSASESRIRDADMAKEMMNLTKANVLQQAATAMLSQANQAPQNILQLLR